MITNQHNSVNKFESGGSIIGRTAQSKEIIFLPLTKNDLIGIAESFIAASDDHSWDMKRY